MGLMMLLLDGIGIAGTSGSVAMPAKPKTSAKRKANARDNKLYQKWDNDPDPKARDYMRDFCYRRRQCPLCGESRLFANDLRLPSLTDTVEKCPAVIGFAIGEAFWAYCWLGVAALAGERHGRIAMPLMQSARTLHLLAGRVDAAPSA